MDAVPSVVAERFGVQAAADLGRYAERLVTDGVIRGLIGPREVPRIWDRHLLNSIALSELLPTGVRLVDIGTGAGLPGLALACVREDLTVDLVESLQRRTQFLNEVVADLSVAGRVRVTHGRAEDSAVVQLVGSARFVTARAVAPLDRLSRWAMPLLQVGGELLAMKGASAAQEVSDHSAAIGRARGRVKEVEECGVGWLDQPARVVIVERKAG
jgi:16S rRNA (guanine527-N7)-methyltransferase